MWTRHKWGNLSHVVFLDQNFRSKYILGQKPKSWTHPLQKGVGGGCLYGGQVRKLCLSFSFFFFRSVWSNDQCSANVYEFETYWTLKKEYSFGLNPEIGQNSSNVTNLACLGTIFCVFSFKKKMPLISLLKSSVGLREERIYAVRLGTRRFWLWFER